jgi:hypothetical protein
MRCQDNSRTYHWQYARGPVMNRTRGMVRIIYVSSVISISSSPSVATACHPKPGVLVDGSYRRDKDAVKDIVSNACLHEGHNAHEIASAGPSMLRVA